MADVKVSGLPSDSSLDNNHYVPINDPSGPTTKRTLLSTFAAWLFDQVNIPAGSGSPITRFDEAFYDFAQTGLVWTGDAYASTRNASMTSGIIYINGRRISISAVSARAFTASKDTYVDILDNLDGTASLVYTEVVNNAASPALVSNSFRLAIIVTGATNIAAVGSINQGSVDVVLPIIASVPMTWTDSLGNLINCRTPDPEIIGYRQNIAGQATTSTTPVAVTGMTMPFIVPKSGNYCFDYSGLATSSAVGNYNEVGFHDNTVATARFCFTSSNSTTQHRHSLTFPQPRTAGSATVQLGFTGGASGTSTIVAAATYKTIMVVRRMN